MGSGDGLVQQERLGSQLRPGDRSSGPRLRAMSLLSSAKGATGMDADKGGIGSETVLQRDQQQEDADGGEQSDQDQKEVERERPWEMQMFQEFPYQKEADQWSGICSGWMIRLHGKKRTRLFNPSQRRTVNVNDLGINRTTVLFLDDGTRLVKHDEWTSGHRMPDGVHGRQLEKFHVLQAEGQQAGKSRRDSGGRGSNLLLGSEHNGINTGTTSGDFAIWRERRFGNVNDWGNKLQTRGPWWKRFRVGTRNLPKRKGLPKRGHYVTKASIKVVLLQRVLRWGLVMMVMEM